MKKLTQIIVITIYALLYTFHSFSQPCLPEGITFSSQEEIDNFQINYPNCTEIEGNVEIEGYDISNLNGLNVIISIGGSLMIHNVEIDNLVGLNELTTIGGELGIYHNNALINLSGLDNLFTIGGDLFIEDNALISLIGIDNIGAGSIANLTIINNGSLTECEVNSICEYLSAPDGIVTIHDNDYGCSSAGEIANECGITLPCLPYGNYYFSSQEQIDNFQLNYPNCTEIEGDIEIRGEDITNLNGLSVITAIGGDMAIGGNDVLTSLAGLENLASIDGSLRIGYEEWDWAQWWLIGNPYLSSLSALNNLYYIGGDLSIKGNDALTSLMGIDNIEAESIKNLTIENNNSLTECEIVSICGYLSAPGGIVTICNNAPGCNNPGEVAIECGMILPCLPYGNYYFFTQEQIDNFQTQYPGCSELEGDVEIRGEDITNLNGLNVVTTIGGNLNITGNPLLSELTGLENLTFIGGNLNIFDNDVLVSLAGIENLTSLEGSLNLGVIIFIPSPMGGYLYLGNPSLTSLTALNNLTSIEADLNVIGNTSLISLNGLDNVSSIGGTLEIVGNPSLTSLVNLESVTSIGGDFIIAANDGLTNLNGLETLTSVQGNLSIGKASKWGYGGNPSLLSLSGLENITSIGGDLCILKNTALSTCDVQSICDYLVAPNGIVHIYDNAPGCNSQEEVQAACEVSVVELSIDDKFTISPNPLNSTTIIQYTLHHNSPVFLNILDLNGRKIVTLVNKVQPQGVQEVLFNTTSLPAGIYFCVLKTNEGIQTNKIIKLN